MCTLIFVYVLPIYGAECIYMLTHIFDRTRQKTRVLQRGFMPPALRAHVIIPVFRGAYAPRYEYAAPVGALFSLIHLSLYSYRPLSGLCFHSSTSLYSYRPLSGSVFGLPLAVFIPPPVGALFSLLHLALFIPSPVGLCFRSSPRCIHTVPCRGSVFTPPPLSIHTVPCRALFSVFPSLYSYRPLQGLCFRSRTFACNLSQSCFPYSRAWQKNRARRSLFLRAR